MIKQPGRKGNHLVNEQSPYLQQHAYNPVDWYPWGEEAFEKARRENKLIFLSIGYSTCHWCHVMERESFEDEETARILNEHFVSIKVDREERPDIDAAYMDFVVAITGSGGWPLNVFLTPEGYPFYGGTYFPPTPRYRLPSFKQILLGIQEKYEAERETILGSAREIAIALRESTRGRWKKPEKVVNGRIELDDGPIRVYNEEFKENHDSKHGGFKGKPKFPNTVQLLFNLYQGRHVAETLFALRKMGDGGIFDHLGGGFARYSVDEEWIVPHFEKMLYTNALLLVAYSQAWALTKDDYFREKAGSIAGYVTSELLGDDGFYSAQDADSEGEEGAFYVFTHEEIKEHVKDLDLFMKYFDISRRGNFEGKNILVARPGAHSRMSNDELERVKAEKERLLQYRNSREKPAIDTKVITAWNGLMISGLVAHSAWTGNYESGRLAVRVGRRFLQILDEKGWMPRIVGKDIHGFLEDHANMMNAFLDLHQLTLDYDFLEGASRIADIILDDYLDKEGYLRESGRSNEKLFVNDTRVHDSVMPSGVSSALAGLYRVGRCRQEPRLQEVVRNALIVYREQLESRPVSLAAMLQVYWSLAGDRLHFIEVPANYRDSDSFKRLQGIPLFNRFIHVAPGDDERVQICYQNTCKMYSTLDDACDALESMVHAPD